MFTRLIALALSLLLASSGFAVAPAAQGATCAQIADQFDRETKALVAEADQKNIGFLHSQIFAQQTASLRTLTANSTQGTIAVDMKEEWDKAKAQIEKARSYEEALHDAYLCLAPGSSCTYTSLRERLTDEVRNWLDAYTSGGLAAVRERALEASNLIHNYLDRVSKITTDTMTAMSQCGVAMRGQPRVDPNTGQPVPVAPGSRITSTGGAVPEDADDIPEPPSKPVDPPNDGGVSDGDLATIAVLGGAAVAVGVYYHDKQAAGGGGGAKCTRPSTNPLTICSSQGGGSSACTSSLASWDSYCQCTGSSGFNRQTGSCR